MQLVNWIKSVFKRDEKHKLRESIEEIIAEVDYNNLPALTETLQGATAVVSALQGLRDVMIGTQGALLKAAVASKVQRFIPSDYALDFTKTKPGTNRNLDLRREFHVELDKSGIQWTSVLNGGFMELLLSGDLPLINDAWHRIMYFGSVDQVLDLHDNGGYRCIHCCCCYRPQSDT